MSSDSEDDCYGNIAQKLQSIKNKYKDDNKIETNLLDDSFSANPTAKTVDKVIKNDENSGQKDCEVLNGDSDVEEISLDAIIAQNTKKRATRSSKRNADISADNILPTRSRKRPKASKKSNENVVESPGDVDSSNQSIATLNDTFDSPIVPASVNTPRGRARGRRRGRRGGNVANNTASNINSNTNINTSIDISTSTNVNTPSTINTTTAVITTNTTATASVPVDNVNTPETTNLDISTMLRNASRSNQRRGGRRSTRNRRMWLPDYFSMFMRPSHSQQDYPTYNIGNLAEYPDECYNQPLFANSTNSSSKADDVIVVGENEPENDSIDENEELSVKVYWQNRELVKFTIRRFQKLTQIFDFFAKRENVSHDKLFFTYNDKILKMDDTPDSITYSIVKFIDGGIINQSVSKIVQNDHTTAKDGIKLKFQCQNVKRPFETIIRPNDKMAVAMMMCAEHLEKPLDKLKFYFDGDLVTGKNTPKELELEGGECIDVRIIS